MFKLYSSSFVKHNLQMFKLTLKSFVEVFKDSADGLQSWVQFHHSWHHCFLSLAAVSRRHVTEGTLRFSSYQLSTGGSFKVVRQWSRLPFSLVRVFSNVFMPLRLWLSGTNTHGQEHTEILLFGRVHGHVHTGSACVLAVCCASLFYILTFPSDHVRVD